MAMKGKGGGPIRKNMAQGGKMVPKRVSSKGSTPRMQQSARTGNQTPTK
jgi:hypothetical protein